MNFAEFMSILNGEYKETAGTEAQNQCVDLANAYIKYVLGLPIIEFTNAVDFPSKAGDQYDWIVNTPNGVPQEGDLVVWGGTYGHIAIFIEGNATRFSSFDENWPTGSPCHVQEHTYLSPKVLGWLHPKVVLSDLQTQLDQCRTDRDRNWNWFTSVCEALGVGANVDAAVNEAKKLVGNDDILVMRDKQLAEANAQVADLQNQFVDLKKKHDELMQQYQTDHDSYTTTIQEQDTQINNLQVSIQSLKDQLQQPYKNGWQTIADGIIKVLHGK